jgi:hypothetical protein
VTCYWRWRVGRFELHCTLYSRPRPGVCEAVELRLFRTLGDRGYPLLSIGSPAGTDPARTASGRVRSRMPFGAPVLYDHGPVGRGRQVQSLLL